MTFIGDLRINLQILLLPLKKAWLHLLVRLLRDLLIACFVRLLWVLTVVLLRPRVGIVEVSSSSSSSPPWVLTGKLTDQVDPEGL